MKFRGTVAAAVSLSFTFLCTNFVFAQNTANNEILVYPPKKPPVTKKWYLPLEFGEGRFTTGVYSGLNRFSRRRVDADKLDPFADRPLPTRKRESSSFKPGTWNWRPGMKRPAFSYKYKIINLTKDAQGSYEGMPGDYRQNYRPIPHVRFGGTFAPIPPLMGDPTQHRRGWYIKKYAEKRPKKEQYNQYVMDIVNDKIDESYPSLEWVTYSWKHPHKWKYNLTEDKVRPRFGSYEAFSNYDSRFPAYEPKKRYEVIKIPVVPPIHKRSAEKEEPSEKAPKSIDLRSVPSKSEDVIRRLQSASSIMASALRTAKLRQEQKAESEISSSDYDSNEMLDSDKSISLSSVYESSGTNSSSSSSFIDSEELRKDMHPVGNDKGKKILLFNANGKQQQQEQKHNHYQQNIVANNMRYGRHKRSPPRKESVEKLAKKLYLAPKKEESRWTFKNMPEHAPEIPSLSIFRLEDQVGKQKQKHFKMHHKVINSNWNDKHTRERYNKLSRKLYTAQDAPLKTEEKISDTYVPEPFVPPIQYQPDSFWDSIYGRTKEKSNDSSSDSDSDSTDEATMKPLITTMKVAPKVHPGIVLPQDKKKSFLHLMGKTEPSDPQKLKGINEEPVMEARGRGDRGRKEKKKKKLTSEERGEKKDKKKRKGRTNFAREFSLEVPRDDADLKGKGAFRFPTFPPVPPRPYKQPTPYVQPTIPPRPPPQQPFVRFAAVHQDKIINAQHTENNIFHLQNSGRASPYVLADSVKARIVKDNVDHIKHDMLHVQNRGEDKQITGSRVDYTKRRENVIKDNSDRIQSDMNDIQNGVHHNGGKKDLFASIPHLHGNKELHRSFGLPAVRKRKLEHVLRFGDDRLYDPEEISENDKAVWSIGPPLNESEPVLNTEERNYVPEGAYQFPHFRNPNFDPETAYDEHGVPVFMHPNYTEPPTLKGDRIFGLGRGMQHARGQRHNHIARDLQTVADNTKNIKTSPNIVNHVQDSKPNIMKQWAMMRQKRSAYGADQSDEYGGHSEPHYNHPPPSQQSQKYHHNDWVRMQYTHKPYMRRFGGRPKPYSRQLRGGRYRFSHAAKHYNYPSPFFKQEGSSSPFEQLKYDGDFSERWTFTRPMYYRKSRPVSSWTFETGARLSEWDADVLNENYTFVQPRLSSAHPIVTPHMLDPGALEPTEPTTPRHVTAYRFDLARLVWPSYIKEVQCIPTFRTRPPMTSYTQKLEIDISVPDMWGKVSDQDKKVGDFTHPWGRKKIVLEDTSEETTPSYLNAEWQKLYAEVTDSNVESKFSDSETDYTSSVTETIDTQTPVQKLDRTSLHLQSLPTATYTRHTTVATDKQTTHRPTTHRSHDDDGEARQIATEEETTKTMAKMRSKQTTTIHRTTAVQTTHFRTTKPKVLTTQLLAVSKHTTVSYLRNVFTRSTASLYKKHPVTTFSRPHTTLSRAHTTLSRAHTTKKPSILSSGVGYLSKMFSFVKTRIFKKEKS